MAKTKKASAKKTGPASPTPTPAVTGPGSAGSRRNK
jgi:hypothetical protein